MSEEISKSSESESRWYVVHTYSGYENKVKANIEKLVENRGMQDQIHEVSVPVEEVVEVKNGQKKTVQRKIFPGYVLIKMFMNEDTWYVVRNTRGVTSFVGPESKPVPLTPEEVRMMGIDTVVEDFDMEVGDTVKVAFGAFADSVGKIKDINEQKKTATVILSIFGRETPVEFEYNQIIKM
ncbi:MAG: transcription termination/antitermination protein NusG [Clostridiales bacterium]|nr:transcription termination/antitermination protein NusG [Clostridiales bacterium]